MSSLWLITGSRGCRNRSGIRRPLGLAFSCLLAGVPGALAATPFSFVLMAAFLTQIGVLQTGSVLIAVVTAFLTMEAVKYLLASRKQACAAAAEPAAPA
jgi:hypothetical protein